MKRFNSFLTEHMEDFIEYRLQLGYSIKINVHNLNYILNYRIDPTPVYGHRLFINQRKRELTRHGINKICRKYLARALPPKRLK